MGLIRKTLAVGTVGMVRPSSKKQRVAKKSLKELKEQTKIQAMQANLFAQAAANASQQSQSIPQAPNLEIETNVNKHENTIDLLNKLGELKSSGLLTDEEFKVQKQKILSDS
jgi:hypothetical protein